MRSGAAAAAPAGGTRLAGRYLLLDRLGSGGMGVVRRARDELLGREVAIKDLWLPPSATAAERTRLRDRVLGEARAAARFSHPGAVVSPSRGAILPHGDHRSVAGVVDR